TLTDSAVEFTSLCRSLSLVCASLITDIIQIVRESDLRLYVYRIERNVNLNKDDGRRITAQPLTGAVVLNPESQLAFLRQIDFRNNCPYKNASEEVQRHEST